MSSSDSIMNFNFFELLNYRHFFSRRFHWGSFFGKFYENKDENFFSYEKKTNLLPIFVFFFLFLKINQITKTMPATTGRTTNRMTSTATRAGGMLDEEDYFGNF